MMETPENNKFTNKYLKEVTYREETSTHDEGKISQQIFDGELSFESAQSDTDDKRMPFNFVSSKREIYQTPNYDSKFDEADRSRNSNIEPCYSSE